MAVEWLLLWGAGKAVGKLAEPVLKDLAKDIAKDQGKNLIGKAMKRASKLLPHDDFLKLYGKAVKELVEVIDDELQNAGIAADRVDVYAPDVQHIVSNESVRESLADAFTSSSGQINSNALINGWQSLPDRSYWPPDFDWDFVAKTFNRKLKKLREDDEDFRAVLQVQAEVETAQNTKQALGIQPDFHLRNYREALQERYANLHFDTMDTSGANYDGVKLWKVFVPQTVRESHDYLPQVHEIPKEHLRRMVASGELDAATAREIAQELMEERQRAYLDQSPRSVLELNADDRLMRFVVLGDPGAGKSSLLQHLALEWARIENHTEREALPLPLLIELKEYDRWDCPNGKSFVRYLNDAQNWHRLDQIELDKRLKDSKQQTILLLDGLDEIFDLTRREQVVNGIHDFSKRYRDVRIIVTSRIIGYKPQRLSDAEFSHFILQDLDESQVNDFLNRWHDTTFKDARDRESKKARLARAIDESPAICELAGNPLLLTMMAILNRNQELPRERIQLYEQASRLLLHQWDTERALVSHPQLKGHVGPKEKAEMLREIAYAMQSAPEGLAGNLISEDELETMLSRYVKEELGFNPPRAAARDLIEQLRLRNFILCYRGGGSYSFVHRTFLEYFCATAIYQRFVQKLDMNYLLDEIFAPHWQDEKWHEVLCLVAGQVASSSVEQVAQIIEFLLNQQDKSFNFHHRFLAGKCCQELRNPRLLGTAFDLARCALEDLLQFDFPYFYQEYEEEAERRDQIRTKAVRSLVAALLPDNPMAWLKDHAPTDDNWAVRKAAVQELARGWKDDPDTLTWLKDRATKDDNWAVRKAAVQELARGWKDDNDTLAILKDRAAKDNNWDVRQAAVQEIARGWKDDPETLTWLKDRGSKDDNALIRFTAVQELARGWKDHPDTLTWLKDRASKDDNKFVRFAAVRELARGWKDDPDTLTILKESTAKDDNDFVRRAAVEEIARRWKDDPDTLTILKDRAAKDNNGNIRQTAVQEIARGWKDDPDTLNWLKNRVAKDDFYAVRQAAVQELARGWKDDPDTLTILKDRAAKDDNNNVRQAAVQELARGWKDDPDTLTILKDRVAKDDNRTVRQTVVEELANGWKGDNEVPIILKHHAIKDKSGDVRQAAVEGLAQRWKDDPDTLTILKDRAVNDPVPNAKTEEWRGGVRDAALRAIARGWPDDPETLALLREREQNDPTPWLREKAKQMADKLEARGVKTPLPGVTP